MQVTTILFEEIFPAHYQAVPFTTAGHMDDRKKNYRLLKRPYTRDEVQRILRKTGGMIGAVIELDLSEAIERREDEFYGFLGDRLIGEAEALNDITWQVIGAQDGFIHLLVIADASGWLAELDPVYIEQQSRHPYAVSENGRI